MSAFANTTFVIACLWPVCQLFFIYADACKLYENNCKWAACKASWRLDSYFLHVRKELNYENIRHTIIMTTDTTVGIAWSPDRPLTWSDFEADANPAALEDAYSSITYHPTWTVESEHADQNGGTDVILFTIHNLQIATMFSPVLSWARPPRSDAMLHHQQGHFDLGEIVMRENLASVRDSVYGRKFETRGKNEDQRKQFAKEDSGRIMASKMQDLCEYLGVRHMQYDKDTRCGADCDEQLRYDNMFASLR